MPPITRCLSQGEPPLPWVFEAAVEIEGESLEAVLTDAGALARSLQTGADLFGLPAVSTSFDTTLEAEATGATVDIDDAGARVVEGCIRSVDDAFDVDIDAVTERGRVPEVLDATERLVTNLGDTSVLGGVTGPGAMTQGLLAEPEPDDDVVDETMFTASGVINSLANAYLDRGTDGLVVLEPDGVEHTARYRDEIEPLLNVVDHYDATAVLAQRAVTEDDIALAGDVGFDAVTGRVSDPESALEAASEHGIVLGVGIPDDRFDAGTAPEFADGLPAGALVSSEWTVPADTSPGVLHEIMGSLG